MAFKEIASFNSFTNKVYKKSPEGLKEAYRKSLKLKETDLPSFSIPEVSGQSLREGVTNVASTVSDKVSDISSSVATGLKETGQTFRAAAKNTVDWLGQASEAVATNVEDAADWLGEGFRTTEEWVNQKVEEYTPVFEEFKEDVKEQFSAESAVRTMASASPLFKITPINISKFSEFLANNGDVKIEPDDFSYKDLKFLRAKAREVIEKGENKFTYETWGSEEGSVLSSDAIRKSLLGDGNARMATLIGQTADGNVRVENNRLIVEDVYDFNTGPRADLMRKAITLREEGKLEEAQRLSEEALEGLTYFGQVRVWAGVLGAPQGEGSRYILDLGPYNEYKGSPDLSDDEKARRGFGRTSPMSGLITPGG